MRCAGPDLDSVDPIYDAAEKVAHFGENTPLKRPGQPAELAPAYVLLASEQGSFFVGSTININGGDYMI